MNDAPNFWTDGREVFDKEGRKVERTVSDVANESMGTWEFDKKEDDGKWWPCGILNNVPLSEAEEMLANLKNSNPANDYRFVLRLEGHSRERDKDGSYIQ